jgi:hypothetical protein
MDASWPVSCGAARMGAVVRHLIALVVVLWMSLAAALELPRDATLFVTDAAGTIVGVGRLVAGETFEIDLAPGFAGVAVLTFVGADGGVVVAAAVVEGGVVLIDRRDIALLARQAGFRTVRVAPADAGADEAAAGDEPGPVGPVEGPEAPVSDPPDEQVGGGDDDGGRQPPGDLPPGAPDLPIRPPELPVVPADPAAPAPTRP